jgi:hypothetical protein
LAKTEKVDAEKIRALREQHQWQACLALEKAFGKECYNERVIDWTAIAEAAYHAGAAKALYQATF